MKRKATLLFLLNKSASSINILKYPLVFACILLLHNNLLYGQKNVSLELMPYTQWDSYPEFSYVIEDRVSTDFINLKGTNRGIQAALRYEVAPSLLLKVGLGYRQIRFDEVKRFNSMFGRSDARHIAYPSPLFIIFYSDKYRYNTIGLHVGMEKLFQIRKEWFLSAIVTLANYYTFSQYYRITHDYPTGPPGHKYKTTNKRNFSITGLAQLGALKQFGRFSTGPSLLVPIFTTWGQDAIFNEENNSNYRSKWFRGVGAGLQTVYFLSKK